MSANAQVNQAVYTGLRISLFDFQITGQSAQGLTLRCRVANTGREAFGYKKKDLPIPARVVIELDTNALPLILQGHESRIMEAVRRCPLQLKPGDIQDDVRLDIKAKPAKAPLLRPENPCADLAFDTAFIVEFSKQEMLLHYQIRNTGPEAAYLSGANKLAIRVYFVSGLKLTRGALPAGETVVRPGFESLDGVLLPGRALAGDIRISLENRTKFSPNLAFQLDPYSAVEDCARENNVLAVEVRY